MPRGLRDCASTIRRKSLSRLLERGFGGFSETYRLTQFDQVRTIVQMSDKPR